MAKPNYQFEKRQREMEKKKKKAEKAQRKASGADTGVAELDVDEGMAGPAGAPEENAQPPAEQA